MFWLVAAHIFAFAALIAIPLWLIIDLSFISMCCLGISILLVIRMEGLVANSAVGGK